MANLKRNMIELVKNPEEVLKGREIEIERYWTPAFIPFSKVREAMQLTVELESDKISELESIDKLASFVADVYGNQFTKDDIYDKIHGPDAVKIIQENVLFVAQGAQTDETKKFLAAKKD